MKNSNYHDSLYAPFGGFLLDKDPFSGIILKKRWSGLVYCPKTDEREPGAMYPRAIQLEHYEKSKGNILATFECYTFDKPYFPIYESADKGKTWKLLSKVEDTNKGYGCRYQPHLYEIQNKCGSLEPGTILCAGNVIPDDFSSTALHVYKSGDGGKTWEFLSEIVTGGKAEVDPKEEEGRPVWEPFLIDDGKGAIYCFYSDEQYAKEKGYNQALLHKKSMDGGLSWSAPKMDVGFAGGILRPGMPVITKIGASDYVMVYEMVNQDRVPVYFRKSSSLDDWGECDFVGNPILTPNGEYLSGTPYVTWIPYGGEMGTILATGRGFSHIMTNSLGGEGFWEKQKKLLDIDNHYGFAGYSQCIVPLDGGKKILNLCPVHISKKCAMISSAVADIYARV